MVKKHLLKWVYVLYGGVEILLFIMTALFATTMFDAAKSGQDFTSVLKDSGLIVALCVGALMGAISFKLTITNSVLLLFHLFEEETKKAKEDSLDE